jgi:putative membrane protein insertion efficiency factor
MIERLGIFVLCIIIRAYQMLLSPLLIGGCRHWPTCSNYASEALQLHGIWRGGRLSLNRLRRCHPGGSFGYDPVPHPGE